MFHMYVSHSLLPMPRSTLLPDEFYAENDYSKFLVQNLSCDESYGEETICEITKKELEKIEKNLLVIKGLKRKRRVSESKNHFFKEDIRKENQNHSDLSNVQMNKNDKNDKNDRNSVGVAASDDRLQLRGAKNKDVPMKIKDASSTNEAVHLKQQLKNLSSELVNLRTHIRTQPMSKSNHTHHGKGSNLNYHSDHNKPNTVIPDVRTNENTNIYSDVHDLIHLPGPLTEDSLLRALQTRFFLKEYFTNVGPILLSINPLKDNKNPLTLSSTSQDALQCRKLLKIVHESVRQQNETGYPQAIILSGASGSGKTYSSMIILRQLFNVAGGGPETDAFKHLAAAFTVLRSLGSAKTASNCESSRIGHFIEMQVTDGALYRTKIHCYFLDQTRVVKTLPNEKNYHIFYHMLAGLTQDERGKLNLEGCSINNLRYLSRGDTNRNEQEDAARFEAWKSCLSVLGIPFMDVVRVLAAVLLLGNIQFTDPTSNLFDNSNDFKANSSSEIKAVASLLGVSSVSLYRGLTTRTHYSLRGQIIKSHRDSQSAAIARDSLAKALYCRTVATIVRRANSLKRIGSTCGTLSSDSNESVHNHTETSSHHASTIGSNGLKSQRFMNALNSAVRHVNDGFIGILDMFGFEDNKTVQLEHLCINLCAETMQHFYNTHIFKSSIEACKEEGVHSDIEIDYIDNVPCIDFISSLRTGLFSMLDAECSIRGTPESYVQKIRAQHKSNTRYNDINNAGKDKLLQIFTPEHLNRVFGIRHYAGNVFYDTTNFLIANADRLSDDIVAVFHKSLCTFGFATHLFGVEIRVLYNQETVPRGLTFRIAPTAHIDLQKGSEPISTLTQDFHTRLDNLLRTLVHARPHFIRCIKANSTEQPEHFDRNSVIQQIRSLQVLETVNLMAGGLPHRMRFKAFNSRYRLLAPFKKIKRTDDKSIEDCKLILDCFKHAQECVHPVSTASTTWALGKRHIFLSEGARQQLEMLRSERRNCAAILIQSVWRGWYLRRKWPAFRQTLLAKNSSSRCNPQLTSLAVSGQQNFLNRPRPQPITGTPPPSPQHPPNSAGICDQKLMQQTCSLYGIDLENPPPVPPSRSYTVSGNAKLGYPQTRFMKMDFPETGNDVQILKGEKVIVVGSSKRRGYLIVEHNSITFNVPYQFLELKSSTSIGGVNI